MAALGDLSAGSSVGYCPDAMPMGGIRFYGQTGPSVRAVNPDMIASAHPGEMPPYFTMRLFRTDLTPDTLLATLPARAFV